MALAAGSRLGPYEILAPIGAGGMGEVYKARDTRLDRIVAVKTLPAQMSASDEVRQRFEREAKTISQLSHPHICTLYDVGSQDGVEYLVMEYLEGETLSDRLAKGPLALELTLRYGIEIAGALDKAHRQGIVHRDLKPGNVMLTKSGVKLLDFGLAKMTAAASQPAGLDSLPTQAGSSPLTQEGTILGTFQYMAPEQLEGREADARSDIFAFGAVLYEMATGRKAFSGSSRASLISAILTAEPAPVSSVVPKTPPALDRVIGTCLAKDPEDRWQSAHDIGSQVRWIAQGGSAAGIAAPGFTAAPRKRRERIWQAVALAAAAGALVLAGIVLRGAGRPGRVLHSTIPPPADTAFWLEKNSPGPAVVSPDGERVAFAAADAGGKVNLYVRSLETGHVSALAGAEGAQYPFWSPDSRSVGFFAGGKLKTIDTAGGPPLTLCAAAEGKGGSWSPQGVIVFSPGFAAPLFKVSEKGGEPSAVTRLDSKRGDDSHRHPRFLPDGRHFLYVARSQTSPGEGHAILAASLDGEAEKLILRSPAVAEYASGYLLYLRETTLMARPFDAKRLVFTGEAVAVAERILSPSFGTAIGVFSASQNGTLVYQTARGDLSLRLLWFGRDGKAAETLGEAGAYRDVFLSPDGKQAVASMRDAATGTHDLYIFEIARNLRSRFTSDPGDDRTPVWSPDAGTLVFSSNRKGHYDLYRKTLTGSSEEEPLLVSETDKFPAAWSADGKLLVFSDKAKDTGLDIRVLPMDGARTAETFLKTKSNEVPLALSPDSRWLVYASDESGQSEVYATGFPRRGRKWQISQAGGSYSYWSADGKEILYQGNNGVLHAVPVTAHGETLDLGQDEALFLVAGPVPGGPSFSPTADHRRVLSVTGGQEPNALLDLVINWNVRPGVAK